MLPKNCQKITWEQVKHEFCRYGLKQSSSKVYARSLRHFCKYASVNPFDFPSISLERIEDLMSDFIADNRQKLAPKYLNLVFSAVKRWCYIQKMIKTTKLFREIKFDKSSRKTDALSESPLETQHVKTCFKVANLEDAIDLGLYGLVGLRPRLIPQLQVKDIYYKDCQIDAEGRFHFTIRPPIMIIPRTYKGNKGNITFMVFIPTKLAELVEMQLNSNMHVTPQTKISTSDNVREVYYRMKTLLTHPAVDFNGRPYLLRSYADDIIDRITLMFNDEDFKEFLMGHRSRISAIYQLRGLTREREIRYREMYVQACDEWINTHVFEKHTKTEIDKAGLLIKFARHLGTDEFELTRAHEAFKNARISMTQLEARLAELTNRALDNRMMRKFEQLFLRMQQKHNNGANRA